MIFPLFIIGYHMNADLSLHEADLMLRMNDFNWNRRECGRFKCQFMNGILFDKSTTDLSKKLCNLKVTMEHCTAYEAGEKAYLAVKALDRWLPKHIIIFYLF